MQKTKNKIEKIGKTKVGTLGKIGKNRTPSLEPIPSVLDFPQVVAEEGLYAGGIFYADGTTKISMGPLKVDGTTKIFMGPLKVDGTTKSRWDH